MDVVRVRPALQLPRSQAFVLGLVVLAVAGVTVLHYLTSAHLIEYHTVYRSLYYLPIAGAAVAFGLRGGLAVGAIVLVLYLPHVLGMGETLPGGIVDNLLELPVFLLVGGLVGSLADRERAQRLRAEGLRSYIDAVLQSLPLGVATVSGTHPPTPQNRAALSLLPALPPEALAHPPALGYHSFEHGRRPLGLYVASLDAQVGGDDSRVLVIEDLTDRRALEAQLRRVDRLASVGQLAAGVAHEVRNPLAIVRATAQLLAGQAGENPLLRRYTQVLTSESDRIERLISDLLEYARPRPPMPTPVHLADFLDAAARQVQPYALQQGVSVIAEATPSALIMVDAEQLGQALLNLLLNAVQASTPGDTVRLSGRRETAEAEIVVADSGKGMAPEVQDRACDPFFTTRPEGTGLGLALVAAVVQEHGGQVRFASAVGQGTRVSITIPQEVAHDAGAGH
jgi:signal transduction histidine kinase